VASKPTSASHLNLDALIRREHYAVRTRQLQPRTSGQGSRLGLRMENMRRTVGTFSRHLVGTSYALRNDNQLRALAAVICKGAGDTVQGRACEPPAAPVCTLGTFSRVSRWAVGHCPIARSLAATGSGSACGSSCRSKECARTRPRLESLPRSSPGLQGR
jgi:hypothetical protein